MQQATPGLEPGDREPEPQPRQQQAPYAPQQASPGPVERPAAQGAQQGHEPGDPNPERRAAAEWQQQQLLHMHQALQRRQAMDQALAEGRDPGGRVSPALRAGAGLLGGGLGGGLPRAQHAAHAPPGFTMAPVLEGAQAASLQQEAAALAAGYVVGRLAPAEVNAPSLIESCLPAICACVPVVLLFGAFDITQIQLVSSLCPGCAVPACKALLLSVSCAPTGTARGHMGRPSAGGWRGAAGVAAGPAGSQAAGALSGGCMYRNPRMYA